MVIEAVINGEVLTTCEIPDEYLQDIEGVEWQRNFEFREQIVAMHLDAFQKKLDKFFHSGIQVEYRLVFPSKMNTQHEEAIDGSAEDHQIHDRRPTEGNTGHAA